MKSNKIILSLLLICSALVPCDDFLDRQPPSYMTPEDYYQTEAQVLASVDALYGILPSHSQSYVYAADVNTDNQIGIGASTGSYAVGQWKTGQDNGNWEWATIRNINYTINTVLEHYEKGEITGVSNNKLI